MYRMPVGRREKRVCDLRVGESAWVCPWAVYMDSDGVAIINTLFGTDEAPFGTVQMHVARKADGYHVTYQGDREFGYGNSTIGESHAVPIVTFNGERSDHDAPVASN